MIGTIAITLLALYLLLATPDRGDSDSLPWPMLIHTLLDLRVLLVRAPAHVTTGDSP